MAAKKYKRLAGPALRRQGFISLTASRHTLWEADGYILSSDVNGFTESYKRFYFSDIQAFVLRKTPRWLIWDTVLLLVALPFFLPLLFGAPPGAQAVGITVGAAILAIAAVNTAMGPTCKCHLVTAVQSEELPALRRVARTLSVISGLRPKILAAQSAHQGAAAEGPAPAAPAGG